MKFIVENKTRENIYSLMRQAGYRPHADSYIRPLGQDFYPRFHLYITENDKSDEALLSLHLDQRKPRYQGATAHNADYDGKLIDQEADRLKQIFKND